MSLPPLTAILALRLHKIVVVAASLLLLRCDVGSCRLLFLCSCPQDGRFQVLWVVLLHL